MADTTTRKIITIDASQSLKTLRELQKALDDNKKAIAGLDKTTEEYQKGLVDLKSAQQQYNQELRLSVKESQAAKGSYNDLVNQLARLKQEWKNTGDAATRAKLTEQINSVKGKIVEMDHSIGNWQRNVGNYRSAFDGLKGVFTKVTVAVGALVGAWKVFQGAMDQTQSTGDALCNSMEGMKSTYDALMTAVVNGDWSAFSGGIWGVYDAAVAASAAMDQLKNSTLAFDYLSSANQTAFNAAYNIYKDPNATEEAKKDARKQMQDIIDAQYAYAQGYNRQALEAYKTKVVKEAGAANLDIKNVTIAQFRRAMEMDVSLDPTKARAENERLYQEFLRKLKEYSKNNIAGQQRLKNQYADVIAIHAMLELMKDDELKGLSDILTGMERAKQTAQSMEKQANRVETTATKAEAKATQTDTKAAETAKKNAHAKEQAWLQELDALYKLIEAEEAAAVAADFASEKAANAARSKRNAGTLKGISGAETDAAVRARAEIDDERTLQATLYAIHEQAQQKRLELLKRFAQEAKEAGDLTAYLDYEQQAADLSVQITQEEVTEKARLRRQDKADAEQNTQAVLSATQTLLGNTANAYKSYIQARVNAGEISQEQAEKEFQSVKALQYAQTWINTLAGMMSIWAAQPPAPWYVKAAQAAAVLAQGVSATAQIASTTLGSAVSTAQAPSIVTAPVQINAPDQVRTVTSASDEQALNARQQAQRVVLVYSDVQAAGKRVEVTNSESRF